MKVIKCDTCGNSIIKKSYRIIGKKQDTIIHLNINDVDYDFCNLKCLWEFVTNEIHKENPETRFEFGKEN